MKALLVSVILLLIFASCRENSCNPLSAFTGVTTRDASGTLIEDDPVDWKLNETNWGPAEEQLFDSTYSTDCLASSKYTIIAYPNPTSGAFNVMFSKGDYAKVDLRLVDFDCRTLISINGIEDNSIGLEPSGFGQKGVVRLYYKFIEDGCEVRGHGDIRIE